MSQITTFEQLLARWRDGSHEGDRGECAEELEELLATMPLPVQVGTTTNATTWVDHEEPTGMVLRQHQIAILDCWTPAGTVVYVMPGTRMTPALPALVRT